MPAGTGESGSEGGASSGKDGSSSEDDWDAPRGQLAKKGRNVIIESDDESLDLD